MSKTLLIPIDFRVESLNTLRYALAGQNEPVKLILAYGYHLTDSITDLLFYSPRKIVSDLTDASFEDALNIIKNRFANSVAAIQFELLTSKNMGYVRSFLSAQKVNAIYVPKSYRLKPQGKGFDTIPLLKKAGFELHEIEWNVSLCGEDDELETLFVTVNNTN